MVALSPEAQSHLERYIRQIKMALRGHSSVDADEVERDVLGHIETELAGQPEPVDAGQLLDVLDRLGTPDEWLPTETAFERSYPLPSRAEDWRLAYLTLAIFLAGPALFLPMILWPLPPLLFVLSFLCARVTVARSAERDEQLGARRWLVYPALVVWYGVFLIALVGGPALFTAVFVADDPMLPSRLTSWFGEPAWIGALCSIGALLGIWWMLLGLLLGTFPRGVHATFRPFADWFEQRHAMRVSLAGGTSWPLGGDSRTSSVELTSMPFNNRSWFWVIDVRRDLVHAARLLRRNPLVTTTAVLSLAIGIGANTTVFTVANALLFQPPPGVAEPSRLVDIGSTRSGAASVQARIPIISTSGSARRLSTASTLIRGSLSR